MKKNMLEKLFGFSQKEHNISTEIIAGITTFLTMAYILAVNPDIFSALEAFGMPKGAAFTATALASIVGTLVMSIYAKKPFALAPGMGLNAFFVFTVCLSMGYSWQFALTAILIEGIIFILLTITNIRDAIVNSIPLSLKNAMGAGIGLFIAFIGLKNAGIIVDNPDTFVALGDITKGNALLGVIGLIISGALVIFHVKGGLLIGIILTSLIGIPMGLTNFNGVISVPPSIAPIFCKFDWTQIFSLDMLIVVFTFLSVDMFDTIGTVVGLSSKTKSIDKNGHIDRLRQIFMADAIATVAGACFGTCTTTTYVESSAGVAQGGRTGLTSFTTAICFCVALFFSPIFLSIPSAATAPILILVGLFMLSPIKNIDFEDYSESIPAFLTIILMPMSYSISEGIMIGMISYVVLNLICGKFKKLSVTMYILAILFIINYIFI
jgi:Permeases